MKDEEVIDFRNIVINNNTLKSTAPINKKEE